MNIALQKGKVNSAVIAVELPSSKSISNRLLIAQALSKKTFKIIGISEAEDTRILCQALDAEHNELNIGMAGTAYRFLTAYLSLMEGEYCLKCHKRMQERPIGNLVEALQKLGAEISYTGMEGYPPLKIKGQTLNGGQVELKGNVSSQFISALLLIAPYLREGIQLKIKDALVSAPYVDMTIQLMQRLNVIVRREDEQITVLSGKYAAKEAIQVERDWSSAAFFYAYVALGGSAIELKGLQRNSIQGDAFCAQLFKLLGVETTQLPDCLLVELDPNFETPKEIEIDLTDTPDLIPAFIVCASQIVQRLHIKGVKTLRIKESDRVQALKNELEKLNIELIEIDDNAIRVIGQRSSVKSLIVDVYNDHRIAMAFAPLCQVVDEVLIKDSEVVKKSYPNFWEEFSKVAILMKMTS